jgi:hypothetical protein
METGTTAARSYAMQIITLLVAFGLSILILLYYTITLPGDLALQGNVHHIDLAMPVITKLYISLGITLVLAIALIYFQMRNKQTVVVYKERTAMQTETAKATKDAARNLAKLSAQSLTGSNLAAAAMQVLAKEFEAVAGAYYTIKKEGERKWAALESGFALPPMETDTLHYALGEGLVGQVAKTGTSIYLNEIPEGYVQAFSGLGQASPRFILFTAIQKKGQITGVLELATFKPISPTEQEHIQTFANEIGERLN